jgi:hypothetical protein
MYCTSTLCGRYIQCAVAGCFADGSAGGAVVEQVAGDAGDVRLLLHQDAADGAADPFAADHIAAHYAGTTMASQLVKIGAAPPGQLARRVHRRPPLAGAVLVNGSRKMALPSAATRPAVHRRSSGVPSIRTPACLVGAGGLAHCAYRFLHAVGAVADHHHALHLRRRAE